jgi:hypothetical protein
MVGTPARSTRPTGCTPPAPPPGPTPPPASAPQSRPPPSSPPRPVLLTRPPIPLPPTLHPTLLHPVPPRFRHQLPAPAVPPHPRSPRSPHRPRTLPHTFLGDKVFLPGRDGGCGHAAPAQDHRAPPGAMARGLGRPVRRSGGARCRATRCARAWRRRRWRHWRHGRIGWRLRSRCIPPHAHWPAGAQLAYCNTQWPLVRLHTRHTLRNPAQCRLAPAIEQWRAPVAHRAQTPDQRSA